MESKLDELYFCRKTGLGGLDWDPFPALSEYHLLLDGRPITFLHALGHALEFDLFDGSIRGAYHSGCMYDDRPNILRLPNLPVEQMKVIFSYSVYP